MKKLLFLFSFMLSLAAIAQKPIDNYTKFDFKNDVRFSKTITLPQDTISGTDTGLIAYKNGHLYLKAAEGIYVRMAKASESGSPNSNIGSGYRLAVPGTNNIKTLFATNGLTLDSSSNTNALTFKWNGRLSENTLIQGASGVGPVYNLRLTDFYQLRLESFGSYSGFYSDSTGLSTAGGSGSTAMVHGGNYASTANYFKVIGSGVSGSSLFIQNSLGNSFIRLDSFYARPVKKYSILALEDSTNGQVKWKSPEQFASILQPYLSSGSQNLHSVLTAGNTSTIGAQFGDSVKIQGGVNPFFSIKQATSNREYRLRVGIGTGLASQSFSLYDATADKTRLAVLSTGDLLVGTTESPNSHSRLLVYGGSNGANIDALPDSTVYDESNIEVMGADYYGSSFTGYGVAMQFNGNANSGSIMGYSKKNFGQLRFTGETNFIRVLNNRSLRFATNSTERMALDSNGRVGIGYAFPDSWLHVQDNSGAITTAKFDAHEDRDGEIVNIAQAGVKKFGFHSNGSIELTEVALPSTPAAGYVRLTANTDNSKMYTTNDAGVSAMLVQDLQLKFGAGSGADADTTAFTTTALYGDYFNTDTIKVTSVRVVMQGTSPSVTVKIFYNDSLGVQAGATALVTAGNAVTNTTTGTNITSFDVSTIPPNVYVWAVTSTVGTKPKYLSIQLNGYRK